MTAKAHVVGKSAHAAEKQAQAFLIRELPEDYTVYLNSWLAERSGAIYELDAVVVAPHAVFVVEIKSYRGRVEGTDHDWFVPQPIRSPLRTNRLTAQMLKSALKRESAAGGRAWVESYVFLSHTDDVRLTGLGSRSRVHTRETILHALLDPEYLSANLTRGVRPDPVDAHVRDAVHRVLTGVDPGRPPARRVREYSLGSVLDRGDDYVEYLAQHAMTGQEQVLRVYTVPWTATHELRQRIEDRCSWEARVLVDVGRHANVVAADPPFREEIGICLPLEHFGGITLGSWVERYLAEGEAWPALRERLRPWGRVARALHFAHGQGVVHRLLRPEVILVEDQARDPDVRVSGFDLAKQLDSGLTVTGSHVADERLVWTAPEVLRDFHAAEPRSDQFALGALLGLLATGRPLFPSTKAYLQRGGKAPSLSELDAHLPKGLDAVAQKLLAARPEDRFESVQEAMRAVEDATVRRAGRRVPSGKAPGAPKLDPEDLVPGTRLGSDYEIVDRIGIGGLSTVYLALHLPSGQQRALKVARPNDAAEEALRAEYASLRELDHPRVVRALDLSKLVPERLTLVMERVAGRPLGAWLEAHPQPELAQLHRHAEDLLDALAYLERQGIVHKDLKPDNLLLGDEGLTLIDFSLVDQPADEIFVGTALYRDPALRQWDAAADRYAACLCLFELYVGAHAFDAQAPEPGRWLDLDADEIEPAELAAFLRQALAPERADRFGSLEAMRTAFRRAVGRELQPAPLEPYADLVPDADEPITDRFHSVGLSNALRRAGIRNQGQLVASDPEQLRRIRNVGRKRLREALAFREALIARGVPARPLDDRPVEPSLEPRLADDPRPIAVLGMSGFVQSSLVEHGYDTVGHVAAASPGDLLSIPWLGEVKLRRLSRALADLLAGSAGTSDAFDLEAAWLRAQAALDPRSRDLLGSRYGDADAAMPLAKLAQTLGGPAEAIERELQQVLRALDLEPLAPVSEGLQTAVAAAGGILPLGAALTAVVDALPTEDDALAARVARVLADATPDRLRWLEGRADRQRDALALPAFTDEAIADFLVEAER
ncbi:MAG: protein kinase, partial [Chloroflexi bacterium]|nr:protein kinase [Chloroflexota bacterium]